MIREIDNFKPMYGEIRHEGSMTLLFDGKPIKNKINGDCLEKQFEIGGYYLVITSYDWCATEDMIYVTLLDKQLNQISGKLITLEYVDLILKNAIPVSSCQINILFTNNTSVIIHICKIPFLPLKPFLRLRKWKFT